MTQIGYKISNTLEDLNNENSLNTSNNNVKNNNIINNIYDDLDFQEVEEKEEDYPVNKSENLKQEISNGLFESKNHINKEQNNNQSPSVIESKYNKI